ncbi:hypothetical protein SNE40_002130 [Patella caerulea]|uniref:Interleukin 17-like protein n=1 Tax=Patella caerulea TaxID=87958 RepID=A0AAN8K756_PATCE
MYLQHLVVVILLADVHTVSSFLIKPTVKSKAVAESTNQAEVFPSSDDFFNDVIKKGSNIHGVPRIAQRSNIITDKNRNSSRPGPVDLVSTTKGLWSRSTCPWEYQIKGLGIHFEPNFIAQAVCQCSKCFDNHGASNRCEEIYIDYPVLNKTRRLMGEFPEFEVFTVRQSVGCTCARP